MGKSINHSHADVIVMYVLRIFFYEWKTKKKVERGIEKNGLTEYEFSPMSAEPTAKILGE